MKNKFKQNFKNVSLIFFAFILGLFVSRLIITINRTDLIDYFQDYGDRVIYFNQVLDDLQLQSGNLREDINRVFLLDLYCSPMFYYLPKAIDIGEGKLDQFWKGYFMAFNFSNLNKNDVFRNDFNCSAA